MMSYTGSDIHPKNRRISPGRRTRASNALTPGSVPVSSAIVIENQAVPARLSLCSVVARKVGSAL